MIEQFYLDEWRQKAPWPTLTQIEQDLIICRALVCLYADNDIKKTLAFRGGTAINKLFLNSPARYSEDLDFVQINLQGIGITLDHIQTALEWLGKPKRKLTERSVKLIYRYQSTENIPSKLKIEINTTEHYHVFDYIYVPYHVNSSWFNGNCTITTFEIDELMGTKLRALYQRRKGRDLFDMWLMLKNGMINCERVIDVFSLHNQKVGHHITRAMFEQSLYEKANHQDFRSDMLMLLTESNNWKFNEAYDFVLKNVISKLPGESWSKWK